MKFLLSINYIVWFEYKKIINKKDRRTASVFFILN